MSTSDSSLGLKVAFATQDGPKGSLSSTVDRFAVRWRLAGSECAPAAEAVLDALLAGALDAALEATVPVDEQIAVATVDVPPVLIEPGESACSAAEHWAAAVAAAVSSRITAGGPGVVRYPTRVAAVLDLVVCAVTGVTSRAWAWPQLGLLPGEPVDTAGAARPVGIPMTPDTITAALRLVPRQIPAIVATMARLGLIHRLVALLGPDRVDRLTAEAWRALGAVWPGHTEIEATLRRIARARSVDVITLAHKPVPRIDASGKAHLASPLAEAACATGDPALGTALAALAVADAEPAAVRDGAAMPLMSALMSAVDSTRTLPQPRAKSVTTLAPSTGSSQATMDDRVPDLCAEFFERTENAPLPRRLDTTANAGVLFLWHVLEIAPDELDRAGVRWVLYRLAEELVLRSTSRRIPPRADDPALLAFCGLPPSEPPPEPLRPPPPDADRLLGERADAVLTGLRARLEGRELAAVPETALLAAVVYRRAEIVADPGWIDVELDLDEVSVDLRAAGLDLDPGWLPAIGCVVRFRYV